MLCKKYLADLKEQHTKQIFPVEIKVLLFVNQHQEFVFNMRGVDMYVPSQKG